jgi:hypothetical protein
LDRGSTGSSRLTQAHGKKTKVLPIASAGGNFGNDSVTLAVSGYKANRAAQVTVTGLAGANGAGIAPIVTGL